MNISSVKVFFAALLSAGLLALLAASFSACSGSSDKAQDSVAVNTDSLSEDALWDKTEATTQDTMPLPQKIKMLQDSSAAAWKAMQDCENQKFDNVKGFLAQLKNVSGFSAFTQAKKVEKLLQEVIKARFTKETMSNETFVDAYDKKTEELIVAINALADATPSLENYPAVTRVKDEILGLDQADLMKRARYSSFTSKYNQLLQDKKAEIAGLGAEFAALSPLPDFKPVQAM